MSRTSCPRAKAAAICRMMACVEGVESGTAMRRLRRPSWLTVLSSPKPFAGRANAEYPNVHPHGRVESDGLVRSRSRFSGCCAPTGSVTRTAAAMQRSWIPARRLILIIRT